MNKKYLIIALVSIIPIGTVFAVNNNSDCLNEGDWNYNSNWNIVCFVNNIYLQQNIIIHQNNILIAEQNQTNKILAEQLCVSRENYNSFCIPDVLERSK